MEAVSASPYKSIQLLAPVLRPLDAEYVHQEAAAAGFLPASSRIVELRSGKRFVVLSFVASVRGGASIGLRSREP
jgi:hypothetical protein